MRRKGQDKMIKKREDNYEEENSVGKKRMKKGVSIKKSKSDYGKKKRRK